MSARDAALARLQEALAAGSPPTRALAGDELLVELPPEGLLAGAAALLQADPPAHLSAITAVDEGQGVALLYHFWAGGGLTLRLLTAPGESAPSLTPLLPGADWYEREIHDLFGITFAGHPHLTPLLLSSDWQGPPPFRATRPTP